MISIRKLLFLVTTLALAAFAGPGIAGDKTFTITPPSSLPVGTQNIQVTFTNTGTSNFNSFELDATSANLQFNAVPAPSIVTPGFGGTVSIINATTLQFTNTSPVKKSVTVQVNVTTNAGGACGSTNATWFAHAWAGSPSNPSSTFDLTPLPGPTTISVNCTLNFVNQPADAFAGFPITNTPFNNPTGLPVKVRLLVNGSPPAAGTPVSANSASCSITGSASTDASGFASFPALASTASASVSGCGLTASAYSGAVSANSTGTFKIVLPDGTLGCDFTNNTNTKGGTLDVLADMTYGQPGGDPQAFGLIRAPNTDDPTGANCIPVPYTFNLGPTDASFVADKLGQALIVQWVVIWAPQPVDATPPTYTPGAGATAGWSQRRPQFAWGFAGTPTLSQYSPGLACAVDNVYAGLGALPTIPDVDPFHGNTYSQYLPGQTAKMCAAQHGFTAVGSGMVQYWTKVIDTDGFGRNP